MTDTNKIVAIGVAAVLGFAVGSTTDDGSGPMLRDIQDRLTEMEGRVADAAEAARSASSSASGSESAVSGVAEDVAALGGRIDGIEQGVAGLAESVATVRSAQAEAADARGERVAAMQERLAALSAALDEQGAAVSDAMEARGAERSERAEAMAERLAALSATLEEQGAAIARLSEAVAAIGMAPAEAATAAVAEDAGEGAAEAVADAPATATPEADLALSFGDSADVEGTRIFLSRMSGTDAVIRVAGLGDVTVGPASGSGALGNGCSLTLKGVMDRTAYLDTDCSGEAMAAVPAPAEADAEMAETFALRPGMSASVGEGRVFLSRADAEGSVLRIAGGGDVTLSVAGGPVRLADGCLLALTGVSDRVAAFATSCAVEAAEIAMASGSAPADDSAAEAPSAEVLLASAGEGAFLLGVGRAAPVGDASVFYSRRSGNDVVLFVRGAGQLTVGPDAGPAEVGGCTLSLAGIGEDGAVLVPDCSG
jgi:hypothetical protein